MLTSGKSFRKILFSALLIVALLLPSAAVLAEETGPNPHVIPILGPRTAPPPIPNSDVLKPNQIWNDVPAASTRARSASIATVAAKGALADGKPLILRDVSNVAKGTTLNYMNAASPVVCNNFDKNGKWASSGGEAPKIGPWTDWYGNWGPFAVNDGFYQAKNVTFSQESVVGPGSHYDDDGTSTAVGDTVDGRHSIKIASTQPYAGGFASPVFSAPAGAEVTVMARYMIANHGGKAGYDWASLGVKADAYGSTARYVNGVTRGQWSSMSNTVTVGDSGMFMVMIQGESPKSLNSNIYFDDISISVNGVYVTSCE